MVHAKQVVRLGALLLVALILLSSADAQAARRGAGRRLRGQGRRVNNNAFFNNNNLFQNQLLANLFLGNFANNNNNFNNQLGFGLGGAFTGFNNQQFDPNGALGGNGQLDNSVAFGNNGFVPINGQQFVGNRVGFGTQLFAFDPNNQTQFVRLGSGLNGSVIPLGEVSSATTRAQIQNFSQGIDSVVTAPRGRAIASPR